MSPNDSPLTPPHETTYPYSRPYEVLAARNATLRLRASDGNIYSFTDLICANDAVNFGHMNPAIRPFTSLTSDVVAGFYPPNATSYATWLLGKLKLTSHSVLYQVGASSALSSAIAIAQRIRPGKILTIQGSSHCPPSDPPADDLDNRILCIPAGDEFSSWDQVSCILYQPIQTANGYLPLPLAWLKSLSQSAKAAGVTVIADEIQCGFYRFGFLSIARQENLNPDIYLFGNSLTNGIYPTSVVIYPCAAHSVIPSADNNFNQTFQTASLGLDAAEAVAAYIDSTDIAGKIAVIHGLLAKAVERLATNPALFQFHLAGPTLSFSVRDNRAAEIIRYCEERGVLISAPGSAQRLRIAPPITIPDEQLTAALNIIEAAASSL